MRVSVLKISKRVALAATAFALAVSTLTASVPFILSQRVGAAGTAVVTNEAELLAAATDQSVTAISLKANVATSQKLVFSGRSVYIDGNANKITFNGDAAGWQGNYVIQAYKINFGTKNLSIAGGDAAVYVNGSTYNVQGNLDVSNNEFGGIEVSQGSGVTTPAILNASAAHVSNSTEENAKPTAWIDRANAVHVNTRVQGGFTEATHIGTNQKQYYLNAANAGIVATNVSTGKTFDSIQSAIDDSTTVNGNTIVVNRDVELVSKSVRVTKSLTIDGNGKTVKTTFNRGVNGISNAAFVILSANTTLKNIIVQGNGAGTLAAHGIVVSGGIGGVNLFNITAKDNAAGVIVNASKVTIHGIQTTNNNWYGINVDKGTVSAPAELTIAGANAHTETVAIWVDNTAGANTVVDADAQYTSKASGAGRAYFRAPIVSIESPLNGAYVSGTVTITGIVHDDNPMNSYFEIKGPDGYKQTDLYKDGRTSHTYAWDTTDLTEGEYTIQFEARDKHNNKTSASVTKIKVIVDNTAPSVTLNTTTDTSTATPTFTGKVSEANAMVVVTIDGIDYNATNNGDGTWSYTVETPLTEGDHDVSVIARDEAGNSSTPATATVTYVGEEEESETPVTQPGTLTPITPAVFPQAITPIPLAQVLGVSTTRDTPTITDNDDVNSNVQGVAETKGAATEKQAAQAVDSDDNKGIFLGLAWYWWILIIAALALLAWWIIAGIRRGRAE